MPSLSFAFPFFFLLSSSAYSFQYDQQSLLAFKKLITSDPNNSMVDWSPAVPLCNWTAITCSRRHPLRVVALILDGLGLGGSISPSLGNLSFLRTLDLGDNVFHGHIPTQLGRLFRLRKLRLSHNALEGNIPTQLGGCRKLIYLALSYNNLKGNIPEWLGSLRHLQMLYLAVNNLTGTIPSSVGNLSALVVLDISYNWMVGSIPSQLGLLPSLSVLNLDQNAFSKNVIPSFLSNISSLTFLSLGDNQFIGCIPQELGLLTNLEELYLHQNELSGTIPTSLLNIFNLSKLFLWGNQITGNIPNSIGNCSKLESLILTNNRLSGSVPVELGKLSFLRTLLLHSNQLDSGSSTTMPFIIALTNCSRLESISLRNNRLRGVLPFAIGRLSNLIELSLAENKIQGNIPPHIGNLSCLTYLNLSGNLLNGNIPLLGKLKNIERLYLANNRLEGNILDGFEQLQHLGLLDISGNMLSGSIPNSLATLKQLRRLILHHNQLSGTIPTSLGQCINLELLDLSHNMLSGRIPQEIVELYNLQFYLNLSGNLLEGSLPAGIGKIAMAQAIDISANHLTGVIPPTLGSCSELQSLNLSKNAFQGSIPDSLGNLQSLVNLDLSSNSLTGAIPVILKKLKMLQFFNLSFNNLKGEIPKGGFFENRTIVMSLIGNPSLCGPQEFGLPTCPIPRGHFAFVKKIVLSVSGAIAFILCCLFLVFLWRGNMCVQKIDFPQAIFKKLEHQRISYQELHTATNGFAEVNRLGTGNSGSVYKGLLSDDTLVAVKVFQLQNDQAEKSFEAECSVLQKVRHRNLVKIITSCSNLHFKALVFEFMANGSLEKHLYPNKDENNGEVVCELGLKARLDIVIDVAHAMEYLHHDSFVQVVHCDIKPSNVLLDEDMVGHVIDFGIARLIGAISTDSLTSTIALKGSIGYIAPEYGLGETISTKGDVYSYGILLLEMLTRKKPTNDMFVGDLNLPKWVNLSFPNNMKDVIDNALLNKVDEDEFVESNAYKCILSLLQVGLLCSKDSSNERPTMRDVVMVLENLREDLVANANASRRLRRSISNLLSKTNATRNDASISNGQSSSTI